MPRTFATELPERMQRLPRDRNGYPIPWFVSRQEGDDVDFRVVDADKIARAIRFSQCWVCGIVLGRTRTYVIGPMCAVNRVSAEPPSHHECAIFSATSCPFLANPSKRRREANLPDNIGVAGQMIPRNPGVALVWSSRNGRAKAAHDGSGVLFNIGDPVETLWFREGRPATRDEVMNSIETGLPLLRDVAVNDGVKAQAALERQIETAMAYVPA